MAHGDQTHDNCLNAEAQRFIGEVKDATGACAAHIAENGGEPLAQPAI
jgi:hypothetical protein